MTLEPCMYGLLAIGAAVMGLGTLIKAADVPAVLVFVGAIFLANLLSAIPWGTLN